MKEKCIRIKYYIHDNLNKLWNDYKLPIIIFSVFFFLGFLTGILTCSEFSQDLKCENLINKYLYDFLIREMNWLSLFLIFVVLFAILCLITMWFAKNKFMVILLGFLLFLMSYIYGFDLCVIIVCLGFAGVVFGVLFYALLGLSLFAVYIVYLSYLTKKVFSKCTEDVYYKKKSIKHTFFTIVLGTIILFFLVLLFSIIHIFVIVE